MENNRCKRCDLPDGRHFGDCLIGGHQAREIIALKERLAEAEKLIEWLTLANTGLTDSRGIHYNLCGVVIPQNVKEEAIKFLTPTNQANCLVCMGATGSAVRHTCKQT